MADTSAADISVSSSSAALPVAELTLRALISSKEAGIIIGRAGATIASIRDDAQVRAGVSKSLGPGSGSQERVLSVGGSVAGVAKAYGLIVDTVLQGSSAAPDGTPNPTPITTTATIRLLISHLLIGSIIGKQGAKIRQIQTDTGVRMTASKEMLPQSTERVVEITGGKEAVQSAVSAVGHCLLEDGDRALGTVLYNPANELGHGYPSTLSSGGAPSRDSSGQWTSVPAAGAPRRTSGPITGGPRRTSDGSRAFSNSLGHSTSAGGDRRVSGGAPSNGGAMAASGSAPGSEERREAERKEREDPNWREQKISIPSDMVGCIIGRAGTKINEIRRLSGSRISIAKTAHDDTGERMFVISGLTESNEKALFLLYNQLESEKERRVQNVQEEDAAKTADKAEQLESATET